MFYIFMVIQSVPVRAQVTVTTVINPPYELPLGQLSGQVMITLLAMDYYGNTYLTMKIEGDNGILIQTPGGTQTESFELENAVPLTLTGSDLETVFSENNLDFTGITASEAYTTGLPEGNYSICFRAWNVFGSPVSPESGGCSYFNITPPPANLTLTTQVTPPYPFLLEELPDKSMVTLLSSRDAQVYLKLHITGDNGLDIRTAAGFEPGAFIELTAHMPYIATGNELSVYFQQNNLQFSGLPGHEIVARGLPEGSYRICFRAFDSEGQALTPTEPSGCSQYFEIRDLDPPTVISPQCGTNIPFSDIPSILFNWTPSPGAPPWTEYTLKIAEVPGPDISPAEAMAGATQPAFFEETVNITSFFYGPGQPILEEGTSYAFVVIATDEETGSRFKNDGRSEVCSFTFGEEGPGLITPGFISPVGIKPVSPGIFPGLQFAPASISGVIKYRYHDVMNIQAYRLKNTSITFTVQYIIDDANTHERHLLTAEDISNSNIPEKYLGMEAGRVLATAVTDDEGNFETTFLLPDSMGQLARDLNVRIGHGDVGIRTHFGTLMRVVRVIVENPYFLSPDDNLIVQPNEALDNVILLTHARDYGLQVQLDYSSPGPEMEKFIQNLGEDLSGIRVYLFKSAPGPVGKPDGEGWPGTTGTTPSFPFKKLIAATTTGSEGKCLFKSLVKAKGLSPGSYFIYAESDPGSTLYFESFLKITGIKKIFQENNLLFTGDQQVWDNHYEYHEYKTTLSLMPKPPRVTGKVVRGDKKRQPLDGANVRLYNMAVLFPVLEKESVTGSGGKYAFEDLQVRADATGNLLPMPRVVEARKEGFTEDTETVLDGATLKLGQQASMRDLVLQLPGLVKGTVVNEEGAGVSAYVYFINGEGTQASSMGINMQTNQWMPAGFSLRSPTGYQQMIVEGNQAYFSEHLGIQVKEGEQTIQPNPVMLKKKQHRIEVLVREGPRPNPGMFFNPAEYPVVSGATVRVRNRTEDKHTNDQGKARFAFGGDPLNDQFTIEVEGPIGKYYEDLSHPVCNAQFTKEYTPVTVYITKGSFVSGHVRHQGQPVAGASVRLAQSGGKQTTAKTNKNGYYKLAGIPTGSGFSFIASKTGYLSHTIHNVNIPETGTDGLNFTLDTDPRLDLSRLLGFDVEVDTLMEQGTVVRISGRVVNLPSNNHFGAKEPDASLAFYNLPVTPHPTQTGPTGNPRMVPEKLPVVLAGQTEISINHIFPAAMRNIRLTDPEKSGIGRITATVYILHNDAFMDNAIDFVNDTLFLANENGRAGNISVFHPGGSSVGGNEIAVCNGEGKDIQYKLYGFRAEGLKIQSVIKDQELVLKTILHTDLHHAEPSDLNISIGEVRIARDKVFPAYGNTTITTGLEKWSLVADAWSLNESGLYFNSGTLKTHMAHIPFTLMKIRSGAGGQKDKLQGGNFQLDKINLEDVTDITLSGETNIFFDPPEQHWKLVSVPETGEQWCGYIPSLPGMQGTDKLYIESITLVSDGTGNFNLTGNEVSLSGAVTFKPAGISVSNKQVSLPGSLDLGIPKVPLQGTTLTYTRDNNALSLKNTPFNIHFFTNGVNINLNTGNEAFSQQNFTAAGTLSEPQKYSINVKMEHGPSNTIIRMTDHEFSIDAGGKQKLVNTSGEMHVQNKEWSHFKFSGDLSGTEGLSGRINLEVIGDIIANDQSVRVENISTPFGNMQLTYDFHKQRFLGNITIDNTLGESSDRVISEGLSEVLIDGEGWYFVSGGYIDISDSPLIKGSKMALLFGSYPDIHVTPSISQVFNTYSYHQSIPPTLQNRIRGFYSDGQIGIGLPIPDINIDMLVCHGKLKVRLWAGMNMGMNFTGPANHYHMGSNITCEASAKAGASAIFGCVAGSIGLNSTYSIDGDYYSNGNWSLSGDWKNTMNGHIRVGGGVCCTSDCSSCKCCCGVCSCGSHQESASAGFNLSVTINRSGFEACAVTPLGNACY
ncbi:MAG: carboxypeptidase regulatory-like domain-containing protein [Bacteroidales bacterium]